MLQPKLCLSLFLVTSDHRKGYNYTIYITYCTVYSKYKDFSDFIKDKGFLAFQMQRAYIWEKLYVDHVLSLTGLPDPVFSTDDGLTEDDKKIYNIKRKVV